MRNFAKNRVDWSRILLSCLLACTQEQKHSSNLNSLANKRSLQHLIAFKNVSIQVEKITRFLQRRKIKAVKINAAFRQFRHAILTQTVKIHIYIFRFEVLSHIKIGNFFIFCAQTTFLIKYKLSVTQSLYSTPPACQ